MAAIFPRDAVDDGVYNAPGRTLVTVNIILTVFSTLMVAARFYVRIKVFRAIGIDDWLILSVVPVSITMTGLYYGEAKYGFGLHMNQVSEEHYLQAWKYYLACQVLYKTAVAQAKASMLMLYLRIFQTKRFHKACMFTMFIVVGTAVGTILATIFQCTPIKKAWQPHIDGHCIFLPAVWYSASSLAILTDVMIIVLPMSQLPRLKLAKGQKIGLAILFSMGFFIIATTVVRLTTLGPSTTSKDQSYYQAHTALWLGIEVNTSIICTCLPPLKSPIAKVFPRLFSAQSTSSNDINRTSKGPRASGMPQNPLQSGYGLKSNMKTNMVSATGGRKGPNDSDEEIMLQGMGGITKKSNIEVTYEDSTGESL